MIKILNLFIFTGVVYNSLKNRLTKAFKPIHLQIINESYMHNVPKGSESHFKVLVVSKDFENIPIIKVSIPNIFLSIYCIVIGT